MRNPLTSHDVPWAEVAEVGVATLRGRPVLRVRATDGEVVLAHGVRPRDVRSLAPALEALAARLRAEPLP